VFDAVIAGQDRPFAAALLWPAPTTLQELATDGEPGTPLEKLTAKIKNALNAFNAASGGSSRRIGRFVILTEPPSIDAGEITDKGYVNQRAALDHRAKLVEALYAKEAATGVVALG